MTLEEASSEVAPIIWAALCRHQLSNDPAMRKFLKKTIDGMCRHMEYFCPPLASQAAIDRAPEFDIDLANLTWQRQRRVDLDRIFHLDHVVTVKSISNAVFCSKSEQDVKTVLLNSKVAWILSEEDKTLTAQGHRVNRPDPCAAYRKAKIHLVSLN